MPRVFLLGALLLGGASCRESDPRGAASEIRGVVLISIDTARADRFGVYGNPSDATPHIDALARAATVFDHAISPTPFTQPSHASMLTGTDPTTHGLRYNKGYRLGDSNLTLAEILKAEGFATHAVVASDVLAPTFGFEQGFDSYDAGVYYDKPDGSQAFQLRRAEEVAAAAAKLLEEQGDGQFFLFLHFYDLHIPRKAPEPFHSRYPEDAYQAELANVDAAIGSVLAKLEQLGLDASTSIILTADHGESLGGHGEFTHGYFVYQDTLRIPLIIRTPGLAKAPRVSQVVGLVDLVPTLLELLGIDARSELDGMSLVPYLQGRSRAGDQRHLYAETFYPTLYGRAPIFALVGDRWKYIHTTRPELYDLESDFAESRNRIGQEPEVAAQLERRLRERAESGSGRKEARDHLQPTDPETEKRLSALGYVTGVAVDDRIDFDASRPDPKDFISVHNAMLQVRFFTRTERLDDADALVDEILSQHPDLAVGHFSKGKVAIRRQNWALAIQHLEAQLALTPEPTVEVANSDGLQHPRTRPRFLWQLAEVHDLVGFAYAASQRYSEAEMHFRKALALEPNNALRQLHLADTLYALGSEQAADAYRQVLELDPDHAKSRQRLRELEANSTGVVDPSSPPD